MIGSAMSRRIPVVFPTEKQSFDRLQRSDSGKKAEEDTLLDGCLSPSHLHVHQSPSASLSTKTNSRNNTFYHPQALTTFREISSLIHHPTPPSELSLEVEERRIALGKSHFSFELSIVFIRITRQIGTISKKKQSQ